MKFLRCLIVCVLLFTVWFQAHAYKQSDFLKKKWEYSMMLEKRLSTKLDSFSVKKLTKLDVLITELIQKYEDSTSLSDNQKLSKLALLYALQEMVVKTSEIKQQEKITITIIGDKRCNDCQTNLLANQLQETLGYNNISYIYRDFSDAGISDFLEKTNINALPAIIFSTNEINDDSMMPYLKVLSSGEYSLQVGAKFNPFIQRSERWFLVLDRDMLNKLNQNTYIDGSSTAEVTVFEFADLECPFCAKVHNDWTIESIKDTYWNKVNIAFKHFPLAFHPNAQDAAELVECTGKQLGKQSFFSLVDTIFSERDASKDFVIDEAKKLWADTSKLEICLDNWDFKNKIETQYDSWVNLWVSWTPAFIIVNNSTREYDMLGGAYPLDSFIQLIDSILK